MAALARVGTGDALVLIDVDHFRSVNERLGHAGGDEVLVGLAHHLQEGVRSGDIVARYGGEEFLLVLPRCPEAEAHNVVQRLLDTWGSPITTFSAGIAMHRPERSIDATLEAADKALYDAKHCGRNRVRAAT
jgi:diguanylate cyclase (GGDEF)-like protein